MANPLTKLSRGFFVVVVFGGGLWFMNLSRFSFSVVRKRTGLLNALYSSKIQFRLAGGHANN